jgi:hypothetical protein
MHAAGLTPLRCYPTLTPISGSAPTTCGDAHAVRPVYDALHPPERSFTESYERDLAQIVLADRLGYHEVKQWGHGGLTWAVAEY